MKIAEYLSPLITGNELNAALKVFPDYSPEILQKSPGVRLMALNDVYRIYIPTTMSHEIYTQLYKALYLSLQKKDSQEAVIQSNSIFKMRYGIQSTSVIGYVDSFTIIGDSGIGKSRTISEALKLISGNNCIEISQPFRKIVPYIVVQAPFDCSVKSLLLEILKAGDIRLNTSFYDYAVRNRATTDALILTVSQIALEHIGMIVVDEIQNVINAKQGRNLIGCLTQLINNAGIPIVMVGTPECVDFFESELFLSRRAVGLRYGSLPYGDVFSEICSLLFKYQYVQNVASLSDDLCYWLWNKTQGNISALISMFVSAQEIAILTGTEELNMSSLQEAYNNRLASLQYFLQPRKKMLSYSKKKEQSVCAHNKADQRDSLNSFSTIISSAKRQAIDPIAALQENGLIEVLQL